MTVPSTDACNSCGNISPRLVATGFASPAALTPTMTISPSKSFGKSVKLCVSGTMLQSIQIRLRLSVLIGPNFGIRIFSTPFSFNLTWNVVSAPATRNVSIARLGYNLPPLEITNGVRRTTPSISGNVFTIPTPTAAFST